MLGTHCNCVSDFFPRCLRVLEHRDLHISTETVQLGNVCWFARLGGRRYEVSVWRGRGHPVAGWVSAVPPWLLSCGSFKQSSFGNAEGDCGSSVKPKTPETNKTKTTLNLESFRCLWASPPQWMTSQVFISSLVLLIYHSELKLYVGLTLWASFACFDTSLSGLSS